MGRGSSKAGGGGGGGIPAPTPAPTPTPNPIQDFPEAFHDGKDYQAVNGVDHNSRTVSRTTQREWDAYANPMNNGVTAADEYAISRQFSWTPNHQGDNVSGYVRTRNSFAINEILYDPKNAGKSVDQMFKRQEDRDTVRALDKAISNNTTQADGSYTRFCSESSVQRAFGLTNAQMALLKNAPNMTQSELAQLNKSLAGTKTYSAAYTSTSANRSLNAFGNPRASQSKGYIFERKLNAKQGTNAWAPRNNAQESETIFGRHMRTGFMGISVASDGHIVIHEAFEEYRP